jgi:hypothetical protein
VSALAADKLKTSAMHRKRHRAANLKPKIRVTSKPSSFRANTIQTVAIEHKSQKTIIRANGLFVNPFSDKGQENRGADMYYTDDKEARES